MRYMCVLLSQVSSITDRLVRIVRDLFRRGLVVSMGWGVIVIVIVIVGQHDGL